MSHFGMTRRRVSYHILLYAIVVTVVAGCGGGDDDAGAASPYKLRTTPFRSNAVREPGESGTQKVRACKVLSPAYVSRTIGSKGLAVTPNNSLDLSICDWDSHSAH